MQIKKLTECEEIVMKAVWDCRKEPVLSEVLDKVTNIYKRSWSPQTVSTYLSKLVQKHYLKLQRNGKIYTYKVQIDEGVYNKNKLSWLYVFLYKGDKDSLKKDLEEL